MERVSVRGIERSAFQDAVEVIGASLLLSLCSLIHIPLFFTPVPLVLQNSCAIALGALLGPRKGALSVALFLLYGWMNLPVFAGGTCSIEVLASTTSGGYLLGYCAGAFVTGSILARAPSSLFLALLAGHMTILCLGTAFLAVGVGIQQALYLGFLPFVGADILKTICLHRLGLGIVQQ
jgi:biotin transport system substrate-specific component